MSTTDSKPLLARIEAFAKQSRHPDIFVPIEDGASFRVLAAEMAAISAAQGGADVTIIVDGVTAGEVASMGEAFKVAQKVVIFGDSGSGRRGAKKFVYASPNGSLSGSDRFFVSISSRISLALVATSGPGNDETEAETTGGWTGFRTVVKEVAELLVDSSQEAITCDLPEEAEEGASAIAEACNFLLMSAVTRLHASKQRDIAIAKSDLTAVLDILKAISAKRRTHDILYVFVEKIAEVVGIDRCSILRIWGNEKKGHVLASHEDATVHDLVIDLAKYPEIEACMSRQDKVVVNDIDSDPLTQPFSKALGDAGISALMVIPIVMLDEDVGSFFLRAVRRSGKFIEREVSFCEIVAEAAANALERAHLFDEIQRANERLEYLAVTDGLTGLYNYRHFRDRLDEEFTRAKRYKLPLSCMLLDIDNFKQVNDTYGHLQGDVILREIARRTTSATRKSDIVARYGGEEMVVIMPQTSLEGAEIYAKRVLSNVNSSPYEGIPEDSEVTVSIGVAAIDPDTTPDYESLIRHSDEALYRAKEQGKNKVILWKQDAE